MPTRGKQYRAVSGLAHRQNALSVEDGLAVLKKMHFVKFDESVDAAVRLGVDPKHADQMVRGAVALPHGTGRTVRVLVFAKGDKVAEARDAGADFAGGQELVDKILNEGWLDFDKVVATPDMMGQVGRIGRVLGPRGLMPNPKTGTVTFEVGKAVQALRAGKIDFRVEKAGIVHATIGRMSFTEAQLSDNLRAFVDALIKLKPATAKGTYVRGVALSGTMTPGVHIDTSALLRDLR